MTSEASSAAGVRALLLAFGTAAACVGVTYAVPSLSDYRPWIPGDPIPVWAALAPTGGARVVEDNVTGLSVAEVPEPEPAALEPEPVPSTPVAAADSLPTAAAADPAALAPVAGLPARPPGVATALVDPGHRGMDPFYRALQRTTEGAGMARAAHYGDSTIAADGITSTVRARLQARFGDGGPGYLSAGMDPRWSMRRDVMIGRTGEWETKSLLLGGGAGRYGYGGIVSTAATDAYLTITSPKGSDGKPTPMQRFELWYQAGAERGGFWASLDGVSVGQGSALAEGASDRHLPVDRPEGYTKAAFGATGGPVTFYGAVMETSGPGVVWDALGVVGVGSRSFTQHSQKHLASQVAQRRPDLVVVMLGGNELGLPVLGQGNGSGYVPYYRETLRRIRAGAPAGGCLVVTPLDQGTREGGEPATKPNLPRLVAAQQKVAEEEGCAFWNAWGAMGGSGAILRWGAKKPPLAWTDLMHLSAAGQKIIGDLLADAIEHGFDTWRAAGGPALPVPLPPGPAGEAAPVPAAPSDSPAPAPPTASPPAAAPAAPAAAPIGAAE